MTRNLWRIALALTMLAPASFAQQVSSSDNKYNHAEAGAFVNYTRLHNANNTNFFGVGARLGFNMNRSVQLEAEGAYDFQRNVDAQVVVGVGGTSFTTVRSGLRMVHFMFGPKFQFGGSSPVRVFVTAKGGLVNFSSDTSFPSQVNNIPVGNTNGVFYPGGGIEFFAGPLGLRFEAGDEMYFDHGANHNLRITAGPSIRF